ncbi:hypothetical protein KNE206_75920 [Kitasatospora sp. NE20-6]
MILVEVAERDDVTARAVALQEVAGRIAQGDGLTPLDTPAEQGVGGVAGAQASPGVAWCQLPARKSCLSASFRIDSWSGWPSAAAPVKPQCSCHAA